MPPKGKGRATPHVQRGIVKLQGNSYYRVEKPTRPHPRWRRDDDGRLVSNLPRRPNIGGKGDLEAFYHVRRNEGEVLPPPQTLWRQRYGDQHTVSYRPLWVEIAGNLADPLRKRSVASNVSESEPDKNGRVGVPHLYAYDETVEPDDHGHQYRRWRPLKVLANGGAGVVITYVDDARGFTVMEDIADEDIVVAKFNYKTGDLVDIMASVIEATTSQLVLQESENPSKFQASRVARKAVRRAARRVARKAARAGEIGAGILLPGDDGRDSEYAHLKFLRPEEALQLDVNYADTFRMENQVLELLDMTGSPHFPKFWKLADPPQDGTLCTMEYIPHGLTIFEHFHVLANEKIPIRLLWQAWFCISKAMSVMAYGSEDPAPSHRVHGWNEIVHLGWSKDNVFVRLASESHTCSHGPCFIVGDFGLAMIVPNKPKARAAFRVEHLKLGWHAVLHERLPEAQIDEKKTLKERIDHPIVGHFSFKSNIFCMADLIKEEFPGSMTEDTKGHRYYKQDNLTPLEETKLARDLQSHLPRHRRLGMPIADDNDEDSEDEDEYPIRVRGYVDVAESLLAQPVDQDLRVSEHRFYELMERCLNDDPAERPEIEEIMLSAARGMAEAGVYVPPRPSSSSSNGGGGDDEEGE